MEKNKIKLIYHFFNFIGTVISILLFALVPAWFERHEEIQFPCSRGEILNCQSPNEVFFATFLSVILLPVIGFLLVYILFWFISTKFFSRWYWFPISVLGSTFSCLLYFLKFGGFSQVSIKPIFLVIACLLPVMALAALFAFLIEKIMEAKISNK